jgi:vitamin B12 transporter
VTNTLATLLALAAATPLAAPASAQTDPTIPTRDADGNEVVVTASRSGDAVPLDTLAASATVIDAAALQQRQTRIVSDVLRDVPGIAVSRAGGVGGFTQLRLRGSEANHVLVLIDGIEVADPYQGEFDFGTLLADEAARIEVLRGQQSSLYGSDAIGGVIQYLTLTGKEAPGVSLRAEGGSFGTASGGARVAGVAGDLDYAVQASGYHTDGTPTARGGRRDVGATLAGGTAKLTWAPSGTFKITGVGRYNYTDAGLNNGDSDAASPTFGYIVDSPGAHFRNKAVYGLVRAELALADGRWTNALSGQFAGTARDTFSSAGLDFGDRGQRYKGSFVSSYRLDTGRVTHRITAAVDVERERFRNTTPSDFVFQGYRHTDNVGLVGQYELTAADALSIGASVRQDWNNRFADTTTWRGQAAYRFGTGTKLHGAYGTGVKNPSYYELYSYDEGRYIGNPDLRPERSKGWEAGVEQQLGGNRARIGATYFNSKLHDEIFTTYPAPAFVATPANRTTLSRQHGIEAYAEARPIDQLRFDLAYTWTHSSENGANEVRRPHHIGSVNVTAFSWDQRFSATLTARYNGRQDDVAYITPDYSPTRVSLQGFVLVNLSANYQLTPGIAVFGRVENLTDERYEEVFSYATPGRAGYGGVKVSF